MRVIVNQSAIFGRKTGVGHYTAELLRCLHKQAEGDCIDLFPNRWIGFAREFWNRFSSSLAPGGGRAVSTGQPAPPTALRETLPRKALRYLRGTGRKAIRDYFHRRYRPSAYDLYHEPNFIPLPSDLPTVATLHDLSVLLHPEWHHTERVTQFERDFRMGLAQCVHFLTPTEYCRQEVIRVLALPPERVTCTYEGPRPGMRPLPPDRIAGRLTRLKLPPRYLLHVGTIEPRKNLFLLMKAYCALPAALRESCPLVLVGSWGWNTADVADFYQREARHRGVIHHGYVADKDLAIIYNGALALTFPSHYEGFGLPPVEMLACGGAVLASTAGAVAETVGRKAHLIDPNDLDGWTAALGRVIADADWRQSLRQGAVEAVLHFTWQRCAAITLAIYRRVAGSTRADCQTLRTAA
jgi:alpha-1,3-rhamnosyl/mannosyltransferase